MRFIITVTAWDIEFENLAFSTEPVNTAPTPEALRERIEGMYLDAPFVVGSVHLSDMDIPLFLVIVERFHQNGEEN